MRRRGVPGPRGGEPAGPPVALTVAGSDNSCGAGIQADLKVFSAHGCYGQTAVTCVVAEVPGVVGAIDPVPSALVAAQVRLSFAAFPVAAAKTGMLYSAAVVRAVAACFRAGPRIPLVVDPVMVASSGDRLLKPDAIHAYEKFLFPLATVLTPNVDELVLLCGGARVRNFRDLRARASELARRTGCAVLAKGGHLGGAVARDVLVDGEGTQEFSAPFVRGASDHGTGCTYSAAVAANLARGFPLAESVARAKDYITASIRSHFTWAGTTALNHFPDRR
jgi:hydroxymethylpyrimidine/phosphomethylpyrimidine kinase